MANYSYVAYLLSGKRQTGTIEAPSVDAAVATISADGASVLEIQESRSNVSATASSRGKISRSDLVLFTRRLADLAAAGLPLDRALQLAGDQSDSQALSYVTNEAIKDVRSGMPISEALAKFPKLFPSIFTMTLKAGEASGQFPQVATRLADFQQTEARRRSQITGSLVYPAILACTAVLVVAFLIFFIVPRLSGVFTDLGSDLPITTKLLLATSGFASSHLFEILIAIVVIVFGYRAYTSTIQGAMVRDRIVLGLPVIGKVMSKAAISRYARILGTLLYGGVPILEALRISGAASGSRVLEVGSSRVEADVREGRRIGESMRETGVFSNILVQMISVGEETGNLPDMLHRVSETLDFEVDAGMQRLIAFVEPVIVLSMGAFVGFVVLSILLPIYQAQDLVK